MVEPWRRMTRHEPDRRGRTSERLFRDSSVGSQRLAVICKSSAPTSCSHTSQCIGHPTLSPLWTSTVSAILNSPQRETCTDQRASKTLLLPVPYHLYSKGAMPGVPSLYFFYCRGCGSNSLARLIASLTRCVMDEAARRTGPGLMTSILHGVSDRFPATWGMFCPDAARLYSIHDGVYTQIVRGR